MINPDTFSTSTFKDLGIEKIFLHEALAYFGFIHATPVQEKCIPKALTGSNLLVQGKNGTGKTLAFSLIALEIIEPLNPHLQVLILTSVREVASQICDFLNEMTFTSSTPIYSLLCCGGYSRKDTIKSIKQGVQIVIGTIGRVKDLSNSYLNLTSLKLLILDEADKICTETDWLYSILPKTCQILTFSATYNIQSQNYLSNKIPDLEILKCSGDDVKLYKLQEYFTVTSPKNTSKITKILEILNKVSFHQCIIFHNCKGHGKDLATRLREHGYTSLNISSDLSQEKRIEVMRSLRFLNIRVMLSTDISSRGIDVLNVNLVINYEMPLSKESYVHRVGRAGRFGTSGIAVTLCNGIDETHILAQYSVVEDFEKFDAENYCIRELSNEELKMIKGNQEKVTDEEGWVDVEPSESIENRFKFSVNFEELKDISCKLCETVGGEHCHCRVCKENYEFIVKYIS